MAKSTQILYILFAILLLSSCKSGSKVQDGETAYKFKKYSLAAEMLQKDFDKSKDITQKSKIALKIADSYDKQLNYKAAESWYKMIADARVLNDAILLYVNALKRNEKYQEAYKVLDDYLKANKSEKFRLQKEMEFLEDVLKKMKKPSLTKLTNLTLNTPSLDFAPFVKDNVLFFSSTRNSDKNNLDEWTGEGYADIYSASKFGNTSFNEPTSLDKTFNTTYHDAELVISKDGKTAFFTRCGTDEKNVNDYCHIYRITKNIDDSWNTPERLKLFADTINEGQAFLSADEKELYFVSDNKDGYGGRDIYLAKKNISGDFELPINAGSKVNTQGDELFPVISEDNKMYFSSNGKTGYGGLDIYVATKEGKIYTNVQNLGFGVNSGGDDFSISLIKSKDDSVLLSGYITSNRPGGKGLDDIYYFENRMAPAEPLPPAVYLLKVLVQAKIYQDDNNPNSTFLGIKPIENATIELPRFDQVAESFQFLRSDKDGNANTIIPRGSQFKIKATKIGYLAGEETVNANIPGKDGDTVVIQKVITLSKIYKNVEITLNNIYYDYDKWNIRTDAAQSLDSLVDILVKNPTIKIQLSSHTDCRGKDTYNETLSQKRAESVVQYLIQKGIVADRLTAKGYGESMPIETCECTKCTEEQHQRNRRTTFKILSE
jgi:outer membrane protein OmpA-like peptidoglycan-associated protein/tetratricopeptide (TPR) repeat protein